MHHNNRFNQHFKEVVRKVTEVTSIIEVWSDEEYCSPFWMGCYSIANCPHPNNVVKFRESSLPIS